MSSAASIDRRVRKESGLLLREARRGLRRFRDDLPSSVIESVGSRVRALTRARDERDGDAMRREMSVLDELVDEHLTGARKPTWREYAESIGIAVLIALVLRAFVVEAFKIPTGSMIPTMEIGDHIFVNKLLYGVRVPFTNKKVLDWREPRHGEVIVFTYPCDREKDYIKRVVAVGGERVEVRCGQLFVNGEPVEQELQRNGCGYWDHDEEGRGFDSDCVAREGTRWGQCSCSRYTERHGDERYDTLYKPLRPKQTRREREPDFPLDSMGWRELSNDAGQMLLEPRCDGGPGDRTPAQVRAATGRLSRERKGERPCGQNEQYEVPAGHVFVMGDNREKSADSRRWGPVPVEDIKGRALFIWWSSKPGYAGGIHIDRIGKLVH